MLGLPEKVRACLFDLDGVLTDTASVHTKAWKAMFDAYLSDRAERTGEKFVPFDAAADYRKYVDGKKREDGVRSFLDSRGIELPDGNPDDPGDAETIYGLGNRKNDMFQKVLEKDGVEVFDGLAALPGGGLGRGSRHRRGVIQRQHPRGARRSPAWTGSSSSGWTASRCARSTSPASRPPTRTCAGRNCSTSPPTRRPCSRTRYPAWQAGHAGNFGFVVGVDRVGQAEDLRRNGADVVVTDLAELLQS